MLSARRACQSGHFVTHPAHGGIGLQIRVTGNVPAGFQDEGMTKGGSSHGSCRWSTSRSRPSSR